MHYNDLPSICESEKKKIMSIYILKTQHILKNQLLVVSHRNLFV